jgi:hypothetical protein
MIATLVWTGFRTARSGTQWIHGSLRRSLFPARAHDLRRWSFVAGGELRQTRTELYGVLRAHRPADHAASPVAERVALVVTKLASNALRHRRSPAVVRLLRADGRLILDVADQHRDSLPEPTVGQHTGDGGRKLHIAWSLPGALCWYATKHGKHIWVSFPNRPDRRLEGYGDV